MAFAAASPAAYAQDTTTTTRSAGSRAVEFSPVSPFIRIYAAQYARRLTDRDELILGGAFANIKYDDGQSNAPSLILGYRRYVWKKAHVQASELEGPGRARRRGLPGADVLHGVAVLGTC